MAHRNYQRNGVQKTIGYRSDAVIFFTFWIRLNVIYLNRTLNIMVLNKLKCASPWSSDALLFQTNTKQILWSVTSSYYKWEIMFFCFTVPTWNKVFLLLLLLLPYLAGLVLPWGWQDASALYCPIHVLSGTDGNRIIAESNDLTDIMSKV